LVKKRLASYLLLVGVVIAQNKDPADPRPETPHLVFVKEYVRELIADEDLKTTAEKEFAQAKSPAEQFWTGIYIGKSIQLELRSQIEMLKGMQLATPYETLIPDLVALYQRQIDLYQRLNEISAKFLAGPKPGVDYSSLAAEVPEIRAELEQLQNVVFAASALVFMTLVDPKPDSQDQVSHLLITKAEKSDLEGTLAIILEGQPNEGDHDPYVSAAMVIRGDLVKKGYKCADEPWE
jgi:hypothetical protein